MLNLLNAVNVWGLIGILDLDAKCRRCSSSLLVRYQATRTTEVYLETRMNQLKHRELNDKIKLHLVFFGC